MNDEQYIKERLDVQQNFHSKKSDEFKNAYYITNIIMLVCTALITISALFSQFYFRLITSFLGAAVTILLGINKLKKYHENWIHYRMISETLKREKYYYLSKSGFYREQKENSFNLLVERVEQIICDENANWAQINTKNNDILSTEPSHKS